ncbi:hypothetical protein [Streptomyces curacoi]|uniref:hypothetical protein n=1 Tax=Streptomyces curacoi TaxID=146536 RepID=UPI000AD049F0|nr:hypothetical protein [Streptomyces curacoi]
MSASAHPTEQVGQTPPRGSAPKRRGTVSGLRPAPALLAATLVAVATLTLTACEDGKGLRDEGPSTPTSPTATAPATPPASERP